MHSVKYKQNARGRRSGNIMKKIRPLASLQSTCFSFFNGFTMIVYNQGAMTDLITRNSKWPQANHMLLISWVQTSLSLILPVRKPLISQTKGFLWQRAPAAWTLNGLTTTHYVQKRLSPFCITQGCILCLTLKKKKKSHLQINTHRN